ncbi:MAG: hypothetical protein WB699_15210 [Bacteroidota bacterium]
MRSHKALILDMGRRALGIAALIVAISSECPADERLWFVSPGVKMAYSFGAGGGFTMGWEVSLTTYADDMPILIPGLALGIYSCHGREVYYASLQVTGPGLLGLGMGPALIKEEGRGDIGVRLETFEFMFAMPEYTHVFRGEGHDDLNDIGLYLKLPIILGEEHAFSLGG